MSIFGNILNKVFHHGSAKAATPSATAAATTPSSPAPTAPAQAPQQEAAAAPAPVDVGEVLESMAAMAPDHGGNYRSSIVDLLKLLGLDSSLAARKALGDELGVHAAADGSAEQNIALHRAVMDKLAENGGVVPDSLRGG